MEIRAQKTQSRSGILFELENSDRLKLIQYLDNLEISGYDLRDPTDEYEDAENFDILVYVPNHKTEEVLESAEEKDFINKRLEAEPSF